MTADLSRGQDPGAISVQTLCRDCGRFFDSDIRTGENIRQTGIRCRGCGSIRLVAHVELTTLNLAHLDCDAYYASIEKRDNPSLLDKPVIVGGGKPMQPYKALFTTARSSSMVTRPLPSKSNAGHVVSGRAPRAI